MTKTKWKRMGCGVRMMDGKPLCLNKCEKCSANKYNKKSKEGLKEGTVETKCKGGNEQ